MIGLVCYMVAGDLEKVMSCWLRVVREARSPARIQERKEVVAPIYFLELVYLIVKEVIGKDSTSSSPSSLKISSTTATI